MRSIIAKTALTSHQRKTVMIRFRLLWRDGPRKTSATAAADLAEDAFRAGTLQI